MDGLIVRNASSSYQWLITLGEALLSARCSSVAQIILSMRSFMLFEAQRGDLS